MAVGPLLVLLVFLLALAALPTWGYSAGWGYAPSGVAVILVILIVALIATGRL